MRVYNPNDKAFFFPYGGKTFCVPPVNGGTWIQESVRFHRKDYAHDGSPIDVRGYEVKVKKVSDLPKRNWVDVPAGAVEELKKGSMKRRMREELGGPLKFEADVSAELDSKVSDKMAEIQRLEAEIAAKRAALEETEKSLEVLAPKPKPARKESPL